MSNDIALFQQEVPAYLKKAGQDDLTKSLAGNTGLKRISIRGSVFRMMVNGEEISKNESRSMNIVIINGAAKVSRRTVATGNGAATFQPRRTREYQETEHFIWLRDL